MICPRCNREIKRLNTTISDITSYQFTLVRNKIPSYKKTEIKDQHSPFSCPECNRIIAANEKEAIDFLSGKKKKRWF